MKLRLVRSRDTSCSCIFRLILKVRHLNSCRKSKELSIKNHIFYQINWKVNDYFYDFYFNYFAILWYYLTYLLTYFTGGYWNKMENNKLSLSTEWFDLVVRGVLVPTLGCLGMIFNIMIIIVLRRPEFTKVSINLIMLCKFTECLVLIIRINKLVIFVVIVIIGVTHICNQPSGL